MTFCGGAAWYLFPKAFPVVQIELTTNRTDILKHAKEQALLFSLGPITDNSCNTAVAFETDITTQTFVELEGGGKEAFTDMMTHHYYEPYQWHVRLFVPQQINEAELYFTPNGALYGFKEKISENEIRTNISSKQALAEALMCAKKLVHAIEQYELIESSKHEQISGRIDHTFVYERKDIALNTGKYRLTITVAGDKVSACQQYVKIPESFERRYQEMRSYNNNLAFLGMLLMVLLYILGACCVGLSLYIKEQLFAWKPALLCAGFIACMHFLNQLNQLPLSLMHYDTVTGMQAYMIRQILLMLLVSLLSFCFFSLIIAVAEGLTRKAFQNHIQLWHVWKKGCANSTAVGLRTLGGYLLTSVDLLLVIVTYLFTTHYFGWWNPSYALIDPNILATYVPALNSVALSLQAGFIEECLFRAIPLATAALLGDYFKKRTSFMVVGFIIQSFIFGAAHANYPAQPFYARLAELIIPSCIWGLFYIRWGLLPIIICHVLYDIVWFSLPIFISHAAGIWIQKSIIMLCAAIPLFIVWYQYAKTKEWHEDISAFLNSKWKKTVVPKASFKQQEILYIPYKNNVRNECIKFVFLIGFLLCLLHSLRPDKFLINLPSQTEVTTIANAAITSHNTPDWDYIKSAQPLPFFAFEAEEIERGHQFMWQMERPNYKKMLEQGYITFPGWTVRYAHFDGDILKRAEQVIVRINHSKDIIYVQHTVPEHYEGVTLTKQEAVKLATDTLSEQYGLLKDDILLKTIIPSKKEHRTDWTIEYLIIKENILKTGEPRIKIVIIGNTIGLIKKYIHVPEQWGRVLKNDMYYLSLAKNVGLLVLLVCILLLLSYIIMAYPVSIVPYKYIIFLCVGMTGLMVLHFFNTLPIIIGEFNTVEPWFLQMTRTIGLFFAINSILILSTTFLLTSAFYIQWPTAYASVHALIIWFVGLGRGIAFGLVCITCFILFLQWGNESTLPLSYEHSIGFANSYAPVLFIVSTTINGFLRFLAFSLLYIYMVHILASKKIKYLILLCGTVFGLSLYSAPKAITFFGYLGITFLCCLITAGIAYATHKKNGWLNIDKRADIGCITGVYISHLYYQHVIEMVTPQEAVGGFCAIIIIVLISVWLCRYNSYIQKQTMSYQP
jgi:hypothetical protein